MGRWWRGALAWILVLFLASTAVASVRATAERACGSVDIGTSRSGNALYHDYARLAVTRGRTTCAHARWVAKQATVPRAASLGFLLNWVCNYRGASTTEVCRGPKKVVVRITLYSVFVKRVPPPPPNTGPWSCDDYTDPGIGIASLIGQTLSSTSCSETNWVVKQYMESVYCTPSCAVALKSETFGCAGDYYLGDAQHVVVTCTSQDSQKRYVTFEVVYS